MLPSVIDEARLKSLVLLALDAPALGAFVEFGVYKGGSAQLLYGVATMQGRDLYLYDTFSGMPFSDAIDAHPVGDFADTDVETIRALMPNAIVVQGVFPESIIAMPPIAFAHIDCDQYRSCLAACDHFGPLMVEGGLMLFDDYRVLESCIKAVNERYPNAEILPDDGRALVRF